MNHSKRTPISPRLIFTHPACLLAFGFGSGLASKAPGTFGTLAAVPLYLAASSLSLPVYLLVTTTMFLVGIWLCGRCERVLGVEDHSGIVWDEFVGFFVTMAAVAPTPATVIAGFALFRLFDVWKPWPIRHFDRSLHGGLGVMLDDVLAGFYACGLLHLLAVWVDL
jgi:phosphatidylglycerophosphatase A